jgi:hypothetical protein
MVDFRFTGRHRASEPPRHEARAGMPDSPVGRGRQGELFTFTVRLARRRPRYVEARRDSQTCREKMSVRNKG